MLDDGFWFYGMVTLTLMLVKADGLVDMPWILVFMPVAASFSMGLYSRFMPWTLEKGKNS